MLAPLFSPNHLKKTHRGGGRKKVKRHRERLRGKKGAVQSWREVIFFSPLHLSSSFSLTSPSLPISVCLSPSPLLPLATYLSLSPSPYWSVSLIQSEVRCQCCASPVNLSAFPKKTSATGALINSICPRTVYVTRLQAEIKQTERERWERMNR